MLYNPDGSMNMVSLTSAPDKNLAAMNGQEFVASTNPIVVAAGNFLNVKFANTSTNKKLIVTKRRFDNNTVAGATPISYGGIANPADIVAPTVTSTGSNLLVGGPTSSAALFTAKMDTVRINNAAGTAVPSGSGFLPTDGEPLKLEEWRVVPPGSSFANFIVGQAAGLGSITAVLTYYWFEVPA